MPWSRRFAGNAYDKADISQKAMVTLDPAANRVHGVSAQSNKGHRGVGFQEGTSSERIPLQPAAITERAGETSSETRSGQKHQLFISTINNANHRPTYTTHTVRDALTSALTQHTQTPSFSPTIRYTTQPIYTTTYTHLNPHRKEDRKG